MILDYVEKLNNFLWGLPMVIILLCSGLYLLIKSRFWVFRNFTYIFKSTFGRLFKDSNSTDETISPFQAVSTALGSTLGAGNIVGVAAAIQVGGPGAMFWMWLAAIVCMTTKMVEVSMAVATREHDDDGTFIGGPMYYIEKGAKSKTLAKIFAFFAFFAIIGIGALVQSNSISESLSDIFGIDYWLSGIIIVGLVCMVCIGGIKRIGSFASKIVPFMTLFYIGGSIVILLVQHDKILPAFAMIFKGAFSTSSALGGFAGTTMLMSIRWGLSRGLLSNEAGLGTAPMAHATSHTDHPIRQGMWGAVEVFISSIVIGTMTALVILTSGLWVDMDLSGSTLTAMAFSNTIPFGKYIVSTSLILFAFTSAVGWCYYAERCVKYLTGSSKIAKISKFVYMGFCFLGSIGGLKFAWSFSDTANALMVVPNIIAIIIMTNSFVRILKDYDKYKNNGKKGSYEWTYENKWEPYFDKKK